MAVQPRLSAAETQARLSKVEAERKRTDLTPDKVATLRELKMLLESKLRMLAMLWRAKPETTDCPANRDADR